MYLGYPNPQGFRCLPSRYSESAFGIGEKRDREIMPKADEGDFFPKRFSQKLFGFYTQVAHRLLRYKTLLVLERKPCAAYKPLSHVGLLRFADVPLPASGSWSKMSKVTPVA